MEETAQTTAPEAQADTGAPEATQPEESPRAAIDRAFETIQLEEDRAKGQEAAPVADKDRDKQGRFQGKEAADAGTVVEKPVAEEIKKDAASDEAPSRFSPDAKIEWGKTPLPVQAEVKRAFSELENGLNEYKTRFETLKPYDELAKQYGTNIEGALENYIGLERSLNTNPVEGLQKIFDYIGVNPRDYAAHVLGQTADQNASQQETIIRDLRNELSAIKQQVTGVTSSIERQNEQAVMAEISVFAASKPRFEELRPEMAKLITAGIAKDLDDSYAMAERLKPAPQAAPVIATASKPALSPQTPKGNLSTVGSPVSGSNPALRSSPKTSREAIDNAFNALGLG